MIYFDNAATTSSTYAPKLYYNPSSPHALGIASERALRDARITIASALNSMNKSVNRSQINIANTTPPPSSDEIVFTSGGTESNNLAILGFTLANTKHGVSLVASPHEHPSITAPIHFAQERNWATAKDAEHKASLISISHINHETGDINDIEAISSDIKKNNQAAVIHIDGAQGFCKEYVSLRNIDMYSFSGHKIHGPTGVGGLWVKNGIRLTPLQHGGGQESNLRAGTENVAAIVQMAESAKNLSHSIQENHNHVSKLKMVLASLQDSLPDITINTLSQDTSPYILNMSFFGVKGEILVHALSEKGVFVSMGAACNSRKRAKSALEIMGFPLEIAQSAVRFSFSPFNTCEEAEQACEIVVDIVKRLRSIIRK